MVRTVGQPQPQPLPQLVAEGKSQRRKQQKPGDKPVECGNRRGQKDQGADRSADQADSQYRHPTGLFQDSNLIPLNPVIRGLSGRRAGGVGPPFAGELTGGWRPPLARSRLRGRALIFPCRASQVRLP